jgi:hypothetical protein
MERCIVQPGTAGAVLGVEAICIDPAIVFVGCVVQPGTKGWNAFTILSRNAYLENSDEL